MFEILMLFIEILVPYYEYKKKYGTQWRKF